MDNNQGFNNPFEEDERSDSTSAFDQTDMSPLDEGDSNGRSLAWIFLGLAAIVCGLLFAGAFFLFQPDAQSLVDRYFPSPTATLTRTPTRTPTPNLTATHLVIQSTTTAQAIQTTIAKAENQWAILLTDGFETNKNHWVVDEDESEFSKISRSIENGAYKWDATAKKGFISWITADTKSVSDFYLTAVAQRTEGSTSDSDYGLVFREDAKSNFYYFAVAGEGFFVSANHNDEWVDVIDWTSSKAILSTGKNRLTVIAEGSHFIFLINDQYVADLTDDRIPKGTAALAVQVHDADQQAIFEFDHFELRVPAPPVIATTTPNLTATSVASEWKEVLTDGFDSNKNSWGTESSNVARAITIIQIADGKYTWDITSHDLVITSQTANIGPLGDFVMSVDARQISGPNSAEYGLTFREDSNFNNYYFGINAKGEYFFNLYYDKWFTLISPTKSPLIRLHEVNRITVMAEGPHFTFFINDQVLAQYTDERIAKGNVGLYSLLFQSDQQAVFEFDNFELRAP